MGIPEQLSLFATPPTRQPIKNTIKKQTPVQKARSGTFTDNMKLPVHRWFRYSAGFSAAWVEDVLQNSHATKNNWGQSKIKA